MDQLMADRVSDVLGESRHRRPDRPHACTGDANSLQERTLDSFCSLVGGLVKLYERLVVAVTHRSHGLLMEFLLVTLE
jgi:hypothetical protein